MKATDSLSGHSPGITVGCTARIVYIRLTSGSTLANCSACKEHGFPQQQALQESNTFTANNVIAARSQVPVPSDVPLACICQHLSTVHLNRTCLTTIYKYLLTDVVIKAAV